MPPDAPQPDRPAPGPDAPPAPAPVAPGPTAVAPRAHGIEVSGLRRAFGTVKALDGADLVARAGAVTALVGPNGSGKTTLLLVLAGLLVPDSGQVRVAGHDPVTENSAARARTGWMPDAFGTWDSLTAREVLTTFADAYRVPRGTAAARVDELLATVHLSEYADQPAAVLSRGQKQRLGLARALVHDPQVLLLDEPASGLDPRSRVDLRILLRRLADEGRTVLVSSHVLSELDEMADDAVFLSRGRTVAGMTDADAATARRTWHVRALSLPALTAWLDSTGTAYRPDGATRLVDTAAGTAPSGGVLVDVEGEAGAAALLRDAVAAGVPVVSSAPAAGALEQAYLALEEERR
ncbi:ABC transporter related protein [Cellulomonas flavigena DSM 20109]|uniref:ABC transporter related protein n=1 Tax=Cellulomonas flavigena (strain ATCC 482 / DSM 20109 / BCRC 11376 / JCM 18109 / NBRC 3775 / NCIMB 8073 / NRS 134) TaxID=446466 RepID=D5ULP7_CELFN|nr:ABC transporter ATP-binding protein [Cellulomonas flavigena]ADG76003.1 ABC transporter related protein [Cellulomonas flavigena DSM 20109]